MHNLYKILMIFKYSRTYTHSPSIQIESLADRCQELEQTETQTAVLWVLPPSSIFHFSIVAILPLPFCQCAQLLRQLLEVVSCFFSIFLLLFLSTSSIQDSLFCQCVACAAPLCANFEGSCQVPLFQKLYISSSFPKKKNPENCANYAAHYLTWKRIRKKDFSCQSGELQSDLGEIMG